MVVSFKNIVLNTLTPTTRCTDTFGGEQAAYGKVPLGTKVLFCFGKKVSPKAQRWRSVVVDMVGFQPKHIYVSFLPKKCANLRKSVTPDRQTDTGQTDRQTEFLEFL